MSSTSSIVSKSPSKLCRMNGRFTKLELRVCASQVATQCMLACAHRWHASVVTVDLASVSYESLVAWIKYGNAPNESMCTFQTWEPVLLSTLARNIVDISHTNGMPVRDAVDYVFCTYIEQITQHIAWLCAEHMQLVHEYTSRHERDDEINATTPTG